MKIIAVNGSPKKNGNTSDMLNLVAEELKKEGVEVEMLQIGGTTIHPCTSCYSCLKNKNRRCIIDTDGVNDYIEKIHNADGVILGSPTYFSNVTSETKAFIDRVGFVARSNDDLFKHKIGAGVVAVRRAGGLEAFNALNAFFLIGQMIVPGSIYWNVAYGLEPGDALNDDEGVRTMKTLGTNIAWLLKKIKG